MVEFAGHLALRAEARADGRTILERQSFRAPYHVSKPYWDCEAGTLLVQIVNPTAGILAGDRMQTDIAVGRDAALLVTTPSASRVFTMRRGTAECRQRFSVEPGAWLEVLSEPLVLHRASRYAQTTSIDVASGGAAFYVDLLMPGRLAHGEAWAWDRLCLVTDVRLGGELVLRERFDQSGTELQGLAALAGFGASACFGNAILVSGDAGAKPAWRERVEALHGDGLWIGVSPLHRGGWNVKFIAADGVRLREVLREIRAALAEAHPGLRCDPRKL